MTGSFKTVAGNTGTYIATFMHSRMSGYQSNRYWIFYTDYYDLYYASSPDAQSSVSWDEKRTIIVDGQSSSYYSAYFDGEYVHLIHTTAASGDALWYRRGKTYSDGTIVWGDIQAAVSAVTSYYYNFINITVDSRGYVYIGYSYGTSGSLTPYVTKNANNNGTWSTAASFPYQLNATTSASWSVNIVTLDNDAILTSYANGASYTVNVRMYDGSWNTELSTGYNAYIHYDHDIVPHRLDNNADVFVSISANLYQIPYVYTTNSLSTAVAVTGSSTYYAKTSIDPRTDDIYLIPSSYNMTYYIYNRATTTWTTRDLDPVSDIYGWNYVNVPLFVDNGVWLTYTHRNDGTGGTSTYAYNIEFRLSRFTNGFEGGVGEWTGTNVTAGNTHEVTYNQYKEGRQSVRAIAAASSAAASYKYITDSATVYTRAYFKIVSNGNTADLIWFGYNQTATTNGIAEVRIKTGTWGGSSTVLTVNNIIATETYDSSTFTTEFNRWYCIEARLVVSATVGQAQVWVDGTSMINVSSKNFGANGVETVAFGIPYAWTSSTELYYDEAAIDTFARIGPKNEFETGFETGTDFTEWTSNVGDVGRSEVLDTVPRSGQYGAKFSADSSQSSYAAIILPISYKRLYLKCSFKVNTLSGGSGAEIFYFFTSTTGLTTYAVLTSTGKMRVYDYAGGTYAESTTTFIPGKWYEIEIGTVTSTSSNGSVVLYVDNVLEDIEVGLSNSTYVLQQVRVGIPWVSVGPFSVCIDNVVIDEKFIPFEQTPTKLITKAGADTFTSGNTLAADFFHTLYPGSNRLIVVSTLAENTGTCDVTGITYGGVAMTKATDAIVGSTVYLNGEMWYLLESSLPRDGTNSIVVTYSGTPSSTENSAYCAQYNNVWQSAPEATDTDTIAASTPLDITSTISPTANAWVISVIGAGGAGSYAHGGTQVEVLDFADASTQLAYAELRVANGETSLTSTFTGTPNRQFRLAASFKQAAYDRTSSLTESTTVTESRTNTYTKNKITASLSEYMSLLVTGNFSYDFPITWEESLSLVRTARNTLSEALSAIDVSKFFRVGKQVKESITITEYFVTVFTAGLKTQLLTEAILLTDFARKLVGKSVKEAITLLELRTMLSATKRQLTEQPTLTDYLSRISSIKRLSTETVQLIDSKYWIWMFRRILPENIQLLDNIYRISTTKRSIFESVQLIDIFSRIYANKTNRLESIQLTDYRSWAWTIRRILPEWLYLAKRNLITDAGIDWKDPLEWTHRSTGTSFTWDTTEQALKAVSYWNTSTTEYIPINTSHHYYLEYDVMIKRKEGSNILYGGTHSWDASYTELPGHPGSYDYFGDVGTDLVEGIWYHHNNYAISNVPRTGESSVTSDMTVWHTGTVYATIMFLFNYSGSTSQETYIKNLVLYDTDDIPPLFRIGKQVKESMTIVEYLSSVFTSKRYLSETLSLIHYLSSTSIIKRLSTETIQLTDTISRAFTSKRSISESIQLLDYKYWIYSYRRNVAESIQLVDIASRLSVIKRLFTDIFAVGPTLEGLSIQWTIKRFSLEAIQLIDIITKYIRSVRKESIALIDFLSTVYTLGITFKLLSESVGLIDLTNKLVGKRAIERVTFNPSQGLVMRYPFDEQTNLVNYSEDFSKSEWSGYCGNKDNVTYNTTDITAPDGTYTATKWICTDGTPCDGVHFSSWGVLQTITPAISADTYTVSVWLRGAVGGEVMHIGMSDYHALTGINLTTQWVRYSYTGVNTHAGERGLQFFCYSANSTYYAWGAQLERSSSVGGYIETLSSPIEPSTVNDMTANNNDGTIVGAVRASGKYGSGMLFDVTDTYITMKSTISSSTRTQIAWIKFAQLASVKGANNALFNNLYQHSANNYIYLNGTNDYFAWAGSIDAWYRVALVVPDKTDNINAKLYVNGVSYNLIQQSGTHIVSDLTSVSNGSGAGSFKGLMDEIKVFDVALSSNQIMSDYVDYTDNAKLYFSIGKRIIDSYSLVDILSRATTTKRSYADSIVISDFNSRLTNFKKLGLEQLTLIESVSKLSVISRYITESYSLIDRLSDIFNIKRVISEVIQLLDIRYYTFSRRIVENIQLLDSISRVFNIKRNTLEVLQLIDLIKNTFGKSIIENIQLSDIFSRLSIDKTSILEVIQLVDNKYWIWTFRRYAIENIQLIDYKYWIYNFRRGISENIQIIDNIVYLFTVKRYAIESIQLLDNKYWRFNLGSLVENIQLLDTLNRITTTQRLVLESLVLSDINRRITAFKRFAVEQLILIDYISNISTIKIYPYEQLSLTHYLRYISSFNILRTESISFIDSIFAFIVTRVTYLETIILTDYIFSIRAFKRVPIESISLIDYVSSISIFRRYYNENISFIHILTSKNSVLKYLSEFILQSEYNFRITSFKRTFAEITTITDALSTIEAYARFSLETIALTKSISFYARLFKGEQIRINSLPYTPLVDLPMDETSGNMIDRGSTGVNAYNAQGVAVINNCNATTDWTGTSVSLDTVDYYEATGSVKDTIASPSIGNTYTLSYNPSGTWDFTGDFKFRGYIKSNRNSTDFNSARLYMYDDGNRYRYWDLIFASNAWTIIDARIATLRGVSGHLDNYSGSSATVVTSCENTTNWTSNNGSATISNIVSNKEGNYSINLNIPTSAMSIGVDYTIRYTLPSTQDWSGKTYLQCLFGTCVPSIEYNYQRLYIYDSDGDWAYWNMALNYANMIAWQYDLSTPTAEAPGGLDKTKITHFEWVFNRSALTRTYQDARIDYIRLDDVSGSSINKFEIQFNAKDTTPFTINADYFVTDGEGMNPSLDGNFPVPQWTRKLDGTNYWGTSSSPKLDGTSFTMTMWFKPSESTVSRKDYGSFLWYKRSGLWFNASSTTWLGFSFYFQGGASRGVSISSSIPLENKWYFAACRVKKETSLGAFDGTLDMRLYDSNSFVSAPSPSTGFGTTAESDAYTMVGSNTYWMCFNNDMFEGHVANVKVFNTNLSDNEVTQVWEYDRLPLLTTKWNAYRIFTEALATNGRLLQTFSKRVNELILLMDTRFVSVTKLLKDTILLSDVVSKLIRIVRIDNLSLTDIALTFRQVYSKTLIQLLSMTAEIEFIPRLVLQEALSLYNMFMQGGNLMVAITEILLISNYFGYSKLRPLLMVDSLTLTHQFSRIITWKRVRAELILIFPQYGTIAPFIQKFIETMSLQQTQFYYTVLFRRYESISFEIWDHMERIAWFNRFSEETLTLSNMISRFAITISKRESPILTDIMRSATTWKRKSAESFSMGTTFSLFWSVRRQLIETTILTDKISKYLSGRILKEIISITDNSLPKTTYRRFVTQLILLNGYLTIPYRYRLLDFIENITLIGQFRLNFDFLNFIETMQLSHFRAMRIFDIRTIETVVLNSYSTSRRTWRRKPIESLSLVHYLIRYSVWARNIVNPIILSDRISKSYTFGNIREVLTIVYKLSNRPSLRVKEFITLTHFRRVSVAKSLLQIIDLTDIYGNRPILKILESITLSDYYSRALVFKRYVTAIILFETRLQKVTRKYLLQPLSVTDFSTQKWRYVFKYLENISVSSITYSKYSKRVKETIQVFNIFRHNKSVYRNISETLIINDLIKFKDRLVIGLSEIIQLYGSTTRIWNSARVFTHSMVITQRSFKLISKSIVELIEVIPYRRSKVNRLSIESILLTSNILSKAIAKRRIESLNFTSTVFKSITIQRSESIILAFSMFKRITTRRIEPIIITKTLFKSITKSRIESIIVTSNITYSLRRVMYQLITESIYLTSYLPYLSNRIRMKVIESLSITSNMFNIISKRFTHSIVLTSRMSKRITALVTQNISITDIVSPALIYRRKLFEQMTLMHTYSRIFNISRYAIQSLVLSNYLTRFQRYTIQLLLLQTIVISDRFKRIYIILRSINDNITITEYNVTSLRYILKFIDNIGLLTIYASMSGYRRTLKEYIIVSSYFRRVSTLTILNNAMIGLLEIVAVKQGKMLSESIIINGNTTYTTNYKRFMRESILAREWIEQYLLQLYYDITVYLKRNNFTITAIEKSTGGGSSD